METYSRPSAVPAEQAKCKTMHVQLAQHGPVTPLCELQSGEGGGNMWVHTPDCANEAKVTPVDWHKKVHNATLVGSTWQELYPLRSTLENATNANLIHGARIQPHPGTWPVVCSTLLCFGKPPGGEL